MTTFVSFYVVGFVVQKEPAFLYLLFCLCEKEVVVNNNLSFCVCECLCFVFAPTITVYFRGLLVKLFCITTAAPLTSAEIIKVTCFNYRNIFGLVRKFCYHILKSEILNLLF